jgi:hypothetical protein
MRTGTAELLRDVQATAERILTSPVAFAERQHVADLRETVKRAIAAPSDGERVIDDITGMLITALARVIDDHKDKRWRLLAVYLLDLIVDDVKRAYTLELESLRSST